MNNIRYCPKCGAQIQDGAAFCLHCMTPIVQKQHIQKPKTPVSKNRKIITAVICTVLAVCVAVGGITGAYFYKKNSPICTFQKFSAAVVKTSETMGIDDLWNAGGFKDVMSYDDENCERYSTKLNVGDASISLFFYDGGVRIGSYICDVSEDDVENCKKMLMCVAQAVCNNYFSDIDEVFNDRVTYPFRTLQTSPPFLKNYTDFLERTNQYNSDIKNGASFTSQYINISAFDKYDINYLQTQRKYADKTLYDLSLTVKKA